MDSDTRVKLAVYRHFAKTGQPPTPQQIAPRVDADPGSVVDAFGRLGAQRLLVLEPDGVSIRMAPPFSGVPTQHVIESDGVRYFANCAWDALGVVAALQRDATVFSRCEQSGEPLHMVVGPDGPQSDWIFHCLVPAAHWWDDIVFT